MVRERGKIRRRIPNRPFGWLAGLLSGCLATMIGIVNGVAPFTILCRSMIAGLAIGTTVSLGMVVVRMANMPNEKKADS